MLVQEHVQTAREFLEAADREFAAGDVLQGSEKMWGAASHAVMAVAQQRGWPYGSHRALIMAVRRLAEEYDAPILRAEFGMAEMLHANFYHGFMEDYQLDNTRELARDFVGRALALVD
jgi:uncharacterized protein (UPF0332 family)